MNANFFRHVVRPARSENCRPASRPPGRLRFRSLRYELAQARRRWRAWKRARSSAP